MIGSGRISKTMDYVERLIPAWRQGQEASAINCFMWFTTIVLLTTSIRTAQGEEIFAVGFYSTRMAVYSTRSNSELLAIECGGLHRAYDFAFHPLTDEGTTSRAPNPALFSFAFWRDKRVHVHRSSVLPVFSTEQSMAVELSTRSGSASSSDWIYDGLSIVPQFHGLTANEIALLPHSRGTVALEFREISGLLMTNRTAGSTTLMFATGGEDTTLKIFELNIDPHSSAVNRRLRCTYAGRAHPSSIRCILPTMFTSARRSEQELLLFSAGGEHYLAAWSYSTSDKICLPLCHWQPRNARDTRILGLGHFIADGATSARHLLVAGLSDATIQVREASGTASGQGSH